MKLIGAAEILMNFTEMHGWYYPIRTCHAACEHKHEYTDISVRLCKYCKKRWTAHDADCSLGNAINAVVKKSNKPRDSDTAPQ